MVRKPHGVTVKYMDFCDPQGGTWVGEGGGGLDRRSAVIKSHMKIYPNSGNNIETSKEIKKPFCHLVEFHLRGLLRVDPQKLLTAPLNIKA